MAHYVRQLARGEFATSTSTVAELRKADWLPVRFVAHSHPLVYSVRSNQSRTHNAHNNAPMTDLCIDQFEQLETAMWNSLVNGDGDSADRLLSTDYLGVYTTGFSGRDDYIAALADGPIAASFEISQSQMFVLSNTSVLYSYRADFTSREDGPPEAMYVSSLWCLRDDRWVNVFSQDTPSGEGHSATGLAP